MFEVLLCPEKAPVESIQSRVAEVALKAPKVSLESPEDTLKPMVRGPFTR